MRTLQKFDDRHGLLVFCVLTFIVGLPLFAVFPAASPALQFPLLILGSCAPALAAVMTTGLSQDPLARPELKARLRNWRVAGPWYFFALLLPTVACLGISLGFQPGSRYRLAGKFAGISADLLDQLC